MKLPRDVTGDELLRGLRRVGYVFERQAGSHMILRSDSPRSHSVTVPNHKPLKVGTLSSILHEVALQRGMSVETLLAEMRL
ncbi:type II toxin-antitoxin system HicA family toxin [Prosthecobacter sp.]|uniref:type II toxin-antitoxin system HicA family toxin n=1 Tax=Prosthecobacter sp. TaxID=1965333 RepID=UPI0037834C7C